MPESVPGQVPDEVVENLDSPEKEKKPIKILIVEDVFQQEMKQMYEDISKEENKGHEPSAIKTATDLESALAQLEQGDEDVVITDLYFPAKTGSGDQSEGDELFIDILKTVYEPQEAQSLLDHAKLNRNKPEDEREEYPEIGDRDKLDDQVYCAKWDLHDMLSDPAEDTQPLGIKVALRCKELGKPFIITTGHHGKQESLYNSGVLDAYLNSKGITINNPVKRGRGKVRTLDRTFIRMASPGASEYEDDEKNFDIDQKILDESLSTIDLIAVDKERLQEQDPGQQAVNRKLFKAIYNRAYIKAIEAQGER